MSDGNPQVKNDLLVFAGFANLDLAQKNHAIFNFGGGELTSEICLMNRHAVVLAADSATTVTYWEGAEKKQRFFKGANKILQLSIHQPVGLMIYAAGSFLKVPWEVIIKQFRDHISSTDYQHVTGYADAFFQFLCEARDMFPAEVQDDAFFDAASSAGASFLLSQRKDGEDASTVEVIDKRLKEIGDLLDNEPIHPSLADINPAPLIERMLPRLEEFLRSISETADLTLPSDLTKFAGLCVEEVLKEPTSWFDDTGLVFAGYGTSEIFPSIVEYRLSGIVENAHVFVERQNASISHSVPAWLSGFAQTSMIDTFQFGISSRAYDDIANEVMTGLQELEDRVRKELGSSKTVQNAIRKADLSQLFKGTFEQIGRQIMDTYFAKNAQPMREVLSVLPIEEMATLAETLIILQSLKERVTEPSESVGGPVDVAVITKSEGLVWLRRKHYFSSELNSRYGFRLGREHNQ